MCHALIPKEQVQAYLDNQFPKLEHDEDVTLPTVSTNYSFTNQDGVSDSYIME